MYRTLLAPLAVLLSLIAWPDSANALALNHVGVRVGGVEANLSYEWWGLGTYSTNPRWGSALGVFAEIQPLNAPFLTVVGEALYTHRSHIEHYAVPAFPGSSQFSQTFNLHYLSFPLLFRLRPVARSISPFVQFGPGLDLKLGSGDTTILNALEKTGASFNFGMGADFLLDGLRMEGELRYSHSLTPSGTAPSPLDAIKGVENHGLLLLLGLGF